MVGKFSGLCSPVLKGGNSVFIAVIVSVTLYKTNMSGSNNYGPNCSFFPREIKGGYVLSYPSEPPQRMGLYVCVFIAAYLLWFHPQY